MHGVLIKGDVLFQGCPCGGVTLHYAHAVNKCIISYMPPQPKKITDKFPVCLFGYISKLGNGDHKHKGIPQK